MTDKLEKAVRDGNRASILLDDPVLKEALDKLEQLEMDVMRTCPVDELVERRANVNAIDRLRRTLRAYLDNGKLAKVTLETPSQ
jgi:hypothetical protein